MEKMIGSKTAEKIRKSAKRGLSLLLCACMVLGTVAGIIGLNTRTAEAASSDLHGYKWTRVYSQVELEEQLNKGNKMVSNGAANDGFWTRVLILYGNASEPYFISGMNYSKNKYQGKSVLTSYGITWGADSFVTRTGLETPFIKYAGYDGDNHCGKYYLRFSDGDKLSDYVWQENFSWFGFVNHAAYSSQLAAAHAVPNEDSYKDDAWEDSFWASNCSNTIQTSVMFSANWTDYLTRDKVGNITQKQFNSLYAAYNYYETETRMAPGGGIYTVRVNPGAKKQVQHVLDKCTDPNVYDNSVFEKEIYYKGVDKKIKGVDAYQYIFYGLLESYANANHDVEEGFARFFYNVKGVTDRAWNHDGREIDTIETFSGESTAFMVYLGVINDSQKLDDYSLKDRVEDTIVFDDGWTIKEGSTLEVPKGKTLVLRGKTFNNGRIVVNGGTLIVEGVLDTDDASKVTNEIPPGSIEVINGGVMIVEPEGIVLTKTSKNTETVKNAFGYTIYPPSDSKSEGNYDKASAALKAAYRRGNVFEYNFPVDAQIMDSAKVDINYDYGLSYLYIADDSLVDIRGAMNIAGNISLDRARLVVEEGALLAQGVRAKGDVKYENYKMSMLKTSKGYVSDLFTNLSATSGSNKSERTTVVTMNIWGGSSFVCTGAFFVSPYWDINYTTSRRDYIDHYSKNGVTMYSVVSDYYNYETYRYMYQFVNIRRKTSNINEDLSKLMWNGEDNSNVE